MIEMLQPMAKLNVLPIVNTLSTASARTFPKKKADTGLNRELRWLFKAWLTLATPSPHTRLRTNLWHASLHSPTHAFMGARKSRPVKLGQSWVDSPSIFEVRGYAHARIHAATARPHNLAKRPLVFKPRPITMEHYSCTFNYTRACY